LEISPSALCLQTSCHHKFQRKKVANMKICTKTVQTYTREYPTEYFHLFLHFTVSPSVISVQKLHPFWLTHSHLQQSTSPNAHEQMTGPNNQQPHSHPRKKIAVINAKRALKANTTSLCD